MRGRRIAGFPSPSPPARFLEIILRTAGIDPAHDLTTVSVRDDAARLGLLKAGDATAAVVSSAVLPHQVERMGCKKICFFGDVVRVPTSGLAVNRDLLENEPELVDVMANCFRSSLRIIHGGSDILREALQRYLSFADPDLDIACELIRYCYTVEGRCADRYLISAVDLLRQAMGSVGDSPAESLYKFR